MSKIARFAGNLKAFGSEAQGLERTLFGENTQGDDLTSQVTPAFLRGWGVVGPSEHPSLEDFNAAMYAMSQFIAYQHQMGVPEWDSKQEYYAGALCIHAGEAYSSLVDGNIGSAPPSAKWTKVITVKNGLSSLGLADANGYVGRLVNVQTFTISGTYTPTPGTKKVKIYVTGAGGSGEFVLNAARGAGGGAGGTAIKLLPITLASYAITVGLGTSTTGGSSSFSTIVSATGGAPGISGTGGAGGVGSGGDINLNGGYGSDGPGAGFSGGSGDGGASFWGGGYRSANGSGSAFPTAGAFGGGGGGNASASSVVSRPGVSGVVVIEEYF